MRFSQQRLSFCKEAKRSSEDPASSTPDLNCPCHELLTLHSDQTRRCWPTSSFPCSFPCSVQAWCPVGYFWHTAFFRLGKYEKRGAGALSLREGEAPTPPIPHMGEKRCRIWNYILLNHFVGISILMGLRIKYYYYTTLKSYYFHRFILYTGMFLVYMSQISKS